MLKLHRLKIERFRSLKPCDLLFHDGFNVLLGKNGSGKTTLLRLLADLYSQPVDEILKDEEFELEVELVGVDGIMEAFTGKSGKWRHRPADQAVVDDDADMAVPLHPRILDLLRAVGHVEPPFRFDESLDALQLIYGMRWRAVPLRDIAIPAIERDQFPPCPRDLFDSFTRLAQSDPQRDRFSIPHDRLDFLKRFVDLVGLQSGRVVIERVEKKAIRGGGLRHIFSNFRFYFTRHDGSEFPQDQLSYGQKRLLIFLYCQAAIPQVMIADELVNGLHHDWIEQCIDLIRDRQCFLSSQNPLLLDHLYFRSQEEVQKTFLLCTSEPQADGDALEWRNMSEAEAAAVYGAYQTGVQQVSEILRSLGLW